MNSALVHLTRGRSAARIGMVILIVILGIALATGPEALAFGWREIRRRRRRISP